MLISDYRLASHDAEPVHIQKSAPIDVNEFSQNQASE